MLFHTLVNIIMNQLILIAMPEQNNISTSWFIRNFRLYTGITPKQFIMRKRIYNAEALLQNPQYNINEIARIVGYENPLYFSRIFQKLKGLSPSEYRKKHITKSREYRFSAFSNNMHIICGEFGHQHIKYYLSCSNPFSIFSRCNFISVLKYTVKSSLTFKSAIKTYVCYRIHRVFKFCNCII